VNRSFSRGLDAPENPNAAEALEHLPPKKLVENILATEYRIIEIVAEVQGVLRAGVKQ
jgi:type I restriction enzyme M protein